MTDRALSIRNATIEDIDQLYKWDEKPHVQASISTSGTQSFDVDWKDELSPRTDGTELFIAEAGGVAIGAMQIIDPAKERTHYWGPVAFDLRAIDIWIGEASYLGQGYGTGMMTWAIEHCFTPAEVRMIIIDPLANNLRAHKFYQALGFELIGRRLFDAESDCCLFQLTRRCWNSLATSANC